jgi:hypothetical protein
LNHFIDSYYSSVFHSVVRLTGLDNEKEVKTLTEAILEDLERRKEELAAENRKGVFIYKVVLVHVFSFLEARGDEKRIGFLQNILLIHPSHYARLPGSGRDKNKNPLSGTSQQGDVSI